MTIMVSRNLSEVVGWLLWRLIPGTGLLLASVGFKPIGLNLDGMGDNLSMSVRGSATSRLVSCLFGAEDNSWPVTGIDFLPRFGFLLFLPMIYSCDSYLRRVYRTVLLSVFLPFACFMLSEYLITRQSHTMPYQIQPLGHSFRCKCKSERMYDVDISFNDHPFTLLVLFQPWLWSTLFNRTITLPLRSNSSVDAGESDEVQHEEMLKHVVGLLSYPLSVLLMSRIHGIRARRVAAATLLMLPFSIAPLLAFLEFPADVIRLVATTIGEYVAVAAAGWILIELSRTFMHLTEATLVFELDADGHLNIAEAPTFNVYFWRIRTMKLALWLVATVIYIVNEMNEDPAAPITFQLILRIATSGFAMHIGAAQLTSFATEAIWRLIAVYIHQKSSSVPHVSTIFGVGEAMLVYFCLLGGDYFLQSSLYTILFHSSFWISETIVPVLKSPENFDHKTRVRAVVIQTAILGFSPLLCHYLLIGCSFQSTLNPPTAYSFLLYAIAMLCLVGSLLFMYFELIRFALGFKKAEGSAIASVLSDDAAVHWIYYFDMTEAVGHLLVGCAMLISLPGFCIARSIEHSTEFRFYYGLPVAAVIACKLLLISSVIRTDWKRIRSLRRVRRVAAMPMPLDDDPRLADVCAICMADMTRPDARRTRCGHVFHWKCLQMCIGILPDCPMCRGPLF